MRWPRRRRREMPVALWMAQRRAITEFLQSDRGHNASIIFMSQLYGLGCSYDAAKDAVERAGGTVDPTWPRPLP